VKRRRLYCYQCLKYTYHLPTEESMNQPQSQTVFRCLSCGKTTTEAVQPEKRPRKKRETSEEKWARVDDWLKSEAHAPLQSSEKTQEAEK